MTCSQFYFKGLIWVGLSLVILTACNGINPVPNTKTPVGATASAPISVEQSTITATTIQPSQTPVPLALRVNDFEINLLEYQAELAMYQTATGDELTSDDEQRVLDDLIDQALLAQAALENGFEMSDDLLQSRLEIIIEQMGGQTELDDWMADYGYTKDSFQRALARSIAAAWMRDEIISSVPRSVEQIHARQILLYNSDQADEVLALLEAGNDFGNLALEYDPVTGGDLGWSPRGFLPDQNLEEIAFNLELDAFSPVIETLAGYHILQIVERDPNRELEPQALLALQTQAVRRWLEERRSESDIQILLSS